MGKPSTGRRRKVWDCKEVKVERRAWAKVRGTERGCIIHRSAPESPGSNTY
jgi:hypothetical protein